MDLHLAGKAALITGGAVGLGRTVALRLASEGARVAVNAHGHLEDAQTLAEEIQSTCHVDAFAVRADVSREAEVQAMFDTVLRRFGQLDVLVNNAALCPTCDVMDMSAAQWTRTVEVNLTGTFLCSREMVRQLVAAGRPGRIVNVSSQAAFRGSTTGHAPYDASKGGIVSLTVSMAREMARYGIAVNAVAPGMMLTGMTAQTIQANQEKYLARIPLGRIGDTAEIADVIVFLASERASYMTGATVDVSGGMLMR